MEREQIREQVRAVLLDKLAPDRAASAPRPAPASPPADAVSWRRFDDRDGAGPRPLVTQADVMRARGGSKTLDVAPGAIVTPLARETAGRIGVTLVEGIQDSGARAAAPRADAVPTPEAARPAGLRSVAIAADHGGFGLKEILKPFIAGLGFEVADLGTKDASPVDYPDFAHQVAESVARGKAVFGIMIDGVGVGSAMAANRHSGIRAAPCSTTLQAQSAREHNDANVLTLGGRHLGEDAAKAIVKTFLEAPFSGGRHVPRVQKIDSATRGR